MTATTTPVAERLWSGRVGTVYHRQHATLSPQRAAFWRDLWLRLNPQRVLEVGAGNGLNLAGLHGTPLRVGVDINTAAATTLSRSGRGHATLARAGALPFRDGAFDLVLTCGLLIHVPDSDLEAAFREIARLSTRDVLLLEYDDSGTGERDIPWRGHRGVCTARAYGFLFWRTCPEFGLVKRSELGPADGFDRVTMAHLRRRGT